MGFSNGFRTPPPDPPGPLDSRHRDFIRNGSFVNGSGWDGIGTFICWLIAIPVVLVGVIVIVVGARDHFEDGSRGKEREERIEGKARFAGELPSQARMVAHVPGVTDVPVAAERERAFVHDTAQLPFSFTHFGLPGGAQLILFVSDRVLVPNESLFRPAPTKVDRDGGVIEMTQAASPGVLERRQYIRACEVPGSNIIWTIVVAERPPTTVATNPGVVLSQACEAVRKNTI